MHKIEYWPFPGKKRFDLLRSYKKSTHPSKREASPGKNIKFLRFLRKSVTVPEGARTKIVVIAKGFKLSSFNLAKECKEKKPLKSE